MSLAATAARRYRFGRFVLDPDRRLLLADGEVVALGSRAYDILQLLLERRQEIVSRDDILAHVWRGTIVEGNTLAVQISALRRALGETNVIATVPGRGYRFVGSVQDEAAPDVDTPPQSARLDTDRAREQPISAGAQRARFRPRWRRARLLGPGLMAIVALVVAVGLRFRDVSTANPPRLSIVVLPFRNLGGDVQQDYLADAISDDLTTDLSHIPGSVVIARASADTYKGRAVAADVIGKQLNVRYLLEGSIAPDRDSLHINAQLVDASTGMHLWASAFDISRDQFGTARAEIVQHIGVAIDVALVDIEGYRSVRNAREKPDALDWYLRARSAIGHSKNLGDLSEAQAMLEKAVLADGDFVEALAQLGLVLLHKITDFDDPNEFAEHARAQAVVEKAMRISPRNVSAIVAHGFLAFVDNRCEQAEPSFLLALSIDHNNVQAHSGLAQCAWKSGDFDQMVKELLILLRLDPLAARSPARQSLIGRAYLMKGQPEEALRWLNKAGAATASDGAAEPALSWHDWRRVYLMAAQQLAGHQSTANTLFKIYAKNQPNRTVWKLASYDTRAVSLLKGNAAYLNALQAAGMPRFAEEHRDFGVKAEPSPKTAGDFDPTPLSIPGGTRVDTQQLKRMMAGQEPPFIIDVGRGSAVISGADWLWEKNEWRDQDDLLAELIEGNPALKDRNVVVMADDIFGWSSYNAALLLIAKSCRNVFWYRGGEEAWVGQGNPANDLRSP